MKNKISVKWWPAAKIALIYLVVGVLWILLSDQVLFTLVSDVETLTRLQTYKGWFYILATALLLFYLILYQLKIVQEKELYNRNLFKKSTVGLALCTMDGELVDVNPLYARIIGRSVEQTLKLSYWDITPEEFFTDEHCMLESLQKTGIFGPYEKEYIHKDGHRVPVRLSGRILYRDGIKMVFSSVEDITDLKLFEEKMRQNEHSLSEAQRMAHLGSWDLDLMSGKLEWSDETYHIFGIEPDDVDISYEKFLAMVHPDDRKSVDENYIESVDNRKPYNTTHRLLMHDGSIKFIHENCKTYYNNEGAAIRSIGVVQDITKQYQSEQTLKRLNRSLRALSSCNEILFRAESETELFEKICHIIVHIGKYKQCWIGSLDYDNKMILPVAQAGYGIGPLESIKQSCVDNQLSQVLCEKAIHSGEPCIIRGIQSDDCYVELREQAIEYGYTSFAGFPLNKNNKPLGVLMVYSAEDDSFDDEELNLLQKLVDDLVYGIETLRSHSERDQLNKQLQQAQKMEAIGQLTGGIAHDFNNILTSVIGFTHLALQRFVTEDQTELREYLDEVLQGGERARDLVSQMMAYSRTGSSNASPLQLPPLIKEIIKLMQATLPSSIYLSTQIDSDIPSVMLEPVQFQQILMNLCINARDAMSGKGTVDIRLRVVHIDKVVADFDKRLAEGPVLNHICDSCHQQIVSGDYIELVVTDSGTGISDKDLSRVFEPFFTTKDVGEGSGMGLSMVHGLMHEYGGHIFVDTEVGVGTKFHLLFLPVIEPPPASTENNQQSDEQLKGKGQHVLVLDDDPSIAGYIADLLKLYGYKTTIKTNSTEAVNLFRENPHKFDLLITDLTMPVLTGMEVIKLFREIRQDFPVILCSGFQDNSGEGNDKNICYHGKPIVAKGLLKSVGKLLDLDIR